MTKVKIKTIIKFKKQENGECYGFVTKTARGAWRGCNESDDVKKQIVIVDSHIKDSITTNALYQATLIPMESKCGFIAVDTKLMQFSAKIETEAEDDVYKVTVKFGHAAIVYDPTSDSPSRNNIQAIAKLLRNRIVLKYKDAVAEEFLDCACLLQSIYKRQKK